MFIEFFILSLFIYFADRANLGNWAVACGLFCWLWDYLIMKVNWPQLLETFERIWK